MNPTEWRGKSLTTFLVYVWEIKLFFILSVFLHFCVSYHSILCKLKKGQFSPGFILIIVIVKLFPPANWLVIRNMWLKWDIFKSQVEYLSRFCYFQVDCFFGKKGRKCNNRSIFFKMFVKRMWTSFCTSRLLETVMVSLKILIVHLSLVKIQEGLFRLLLKWMSFSDLCVFFIVFVIFMSSFYFIFCFYVLSDGYIFPYLHCISY